MSSEPAELQQVARVRVIYGDTDQMGMVYYGNYLRYFEIARTEFLRAVGAPYRAFEEAHGLRLPVVEAGVRYRRPARYDDELALFAAVVDTGRASARFDYEIRRMEAGAGEAIDPEPLVLGHTVHACINGAGKLARLPEAFRTALARRP